VEPAKGWGEAPSKFLAAQPRHCAILTPGGYIHIMAGRRSIISTAKPPATDQAADLRGLLWGGAVCCRTIDVC
jgi:hypothetical protein